MWKKISCVTTNVKSYIGCGFPYIIHFYAKIEDQLTPETIIEYDYQSFEDDVELIQTNPERYCLKQVYKMCYYIQKLYYIEIIKMKCEFVKDDNNTIWF